MSTPRVIELVRNGRRTVSPPAIREDLANGAKIGQGSDLLKLTPSERHALQRTERVR